MLMRLASLFRRRTHSRKRIGRERGQLYLTWARMVRDGTALMDPESYYALVGAIEALDWVMKRESTMDEEAAVIIRQAYA